MGDETDGEGIVRTLPRKTRVSRRVSLLTLYRSKLLMMLINLRSHYFYRLTHDYTVPRTPRSSRGWTANFRSAARYTSQDEKESSHRPSGFYPGGTRSALAMKKNTKRLVLSQTMVIDVDPSKVRPKLLVL